MDNNSERRKSQNAQTPTPQPENGVSYFEKLLSEIRSSSGGDDSQEKSNSLSLKSNQPSIPVDTLLQQQRVRSQELNNDKKERENVLISKNQSLKQLTLILLFILLFAESLTLFVMAFFQGFSFYGFDLDLWTLRIIVVASLIQISAMLTIAVRHLFPSKKQ